MSGAVKQRRQLAVAKSATFGEVLTLFEESSEVRRASPRAIKAGRRLCIRTCSRLSTMIFDWTFRLDAAAASRD
jgi:hypothetical protein